MIHHPKTDNRGMVTVVTLLVLLAVVVLSITMVMNSRMNMTSANNYKSKIQSFYAADGVITGLAQEMIDSAENQYLVNQMQHQDIGTYGVSAFPGTYSYNQFTNTDSVGGGGMDIHGKMDDFHFVYRKIGGDVDISVRVSSLTNTNANAVGGIMVRASLATESRCVSVLWPYQIPHNTIFRYRLTDNTASTDANTVVPQQAGDWIRLKRVGSRFTGYCSSDGVTWSAIGSVTIPLPDSIYAGLPVCSYNTGARCQGVFKNLAGLVRRAYTDSVFLEISGNTRVRYTIEEIGLGMFNMTTEGYKIRADGSQNFVAKINQQISRARTTDFMSGALDSVFLPVTYYDFRADLSNPEFNVFDPGDVMRGMVKTTLDADRKPIPTVNSNLQSCMLTCFSGPLKGWYGFSPAKRSEWIDTVLKYRANISTCLSTHAPGFPNHTVSGWWFSDSLRRWFRPSDAPWATFDPLTGKWSNLINRPLPSGGSVPNEWVGSSYNPANQFATIVMYDSLKFREKPKGSGIFVFGDSVNASTVDTQYFIRNCNFWFSTSPFKFMPLKKRGFRYDPARYSPPDSTCKINENFAYTMEMHRKFTYKRGQIFSFKGDDDVWAFINNRLVIDLGGVHPSRSQTVLLDTLGLTEGEEYWFDFFYCERLTVESNIYITTNMLMFAPPQSNMRNWRRDYGNID